MTFEETDQQPAYQFRHWAIPQRMMGGLLRYIYFGIEPGQFLMAVLANDFMDVCGLADAENLANLPAYAGYLCNKVPLRAHGSPKTVEAWLMRDWTKAREKGVTVSP